MYYPRMSSPPASLFGVSEQLFQEAGSGGAGHDNHRADSDVLQRHRQPLVGTVLRHHLGLGTEIA
ncbi:MAG TPA: hypothetical protein VFA18_18950 [Gemmataceae bacterium]|nr:hypothetical protein [Gemmataceae bacterium]